MTNPMIPAEAVEAAAKCLYNDHDGDDAAFLAEVRAALEAAAPYLLAEFEKQRKYDALDSISELGGE